jgi:hypothetical protein
MRPSMILTGVILIWLVPAVCAKDQPAQIMVRGRITERWPNAATADRLVEVNFAVTIGVRAAFASCGNVVVPAPGGGDRPEVEVFGPSASFIVSNLKHGRATVKGSSFYTYVTEGNVIQACRMKLDGELEVGKPWRASTKTPRGTEYVVELTVSP